MQAPDLSQAKELFEKARALSRDQKRDFLDQLKRQSPALHELVLGLLSEDEVTAASITEPYRAPSTGTPDHIGPYRVLSVLGEGGFGIVYEAEQLNPVRRRVAIKLIKPGLDSKAVLARFEAEKQALAVMDHPLIAQIFDGGIDDLARPYFAMELVQGEPIDTFCDRNRLGIEERLGLVIQICEAVQHAHAKGVVHRDLKPSNLLVEYRDNVATPRVIDFGVAKSLHGRLADASIYTQANQVIGTPEYMAPEQASGSGVDIDTRADVYSLGVIIYKLLVGSTPFDSSQLRSGTPQSLRDLLQDTDPPKPSTKLRTLLGTASEGGTGSQIAKQRRIDPKQLSRVLRRDLDWILLKCLDKDRSRRYPTAAALADELQRYLTDQPVEAGPPSAAYRARKFVRRHRAGVLTTVVTGFAILAGFAGTIWQWSIADQERDRANAAALAAEQRYEEVRGFGEDVLELVRDEFADLIGARAVAQPAADAAREMLTLLSERFPDDLELQLSVAGLERSSASLLLLDDAQLINASGLLDAAVDRTRNALRERAAWPEAQTLLCQCLLDQSTLYLRLRQVDSADSVAREAVEIARSLDQSDTEIQRMLARGLTAEGSLGQLTQDLGRAREKLAEAEQIRGSLRATGDIEGAVAAHGDVLARLALLSALEGDVAAEFELRMRSVDAWRDVLDRDGESLRAMRALGRNYLAIADLESSRWNLKAAAENAVQAGEHYVPVAEADPASESAFRSALTTITFLAELPATAFEEEHRNRAIDLCDRLLRIRPGTTSLTGARTVFTADSN